MSATEAEARAKHAEKMRAKHPGLEADAEIVSALRSRAKDGRITCSDAHAVAQALGRTPLAVGAQIDIEGLWLAGCSLGMFGMHHVDQPKVAPDAALEAAIRSELDAAGRLSCAAAWRIADDRGVPRVAVTRACNFLGIRLSACQLGAFK